MSKTYKDTPAQREYRRDNPRIVKTYGRVPQLTRHLTVANWADDEAKELEYA